MVVFRLMKKAQDAFQVTLTSPAQAVSRYAQWYVDVYYNDEMTLKAIVMNAYCNFSAIFLAEWINDASTLMEKSKEALEKECKERGVYDVYDTKIALHFDSVMLSRTISRSATSALRSVLQFGERTFMLDDKRFGANEYYYKNNLDATDDSLSPCKAIRWSEMDDAVEEDISAPCVTKPTPPLSIKGYVNKMGLAIVSAKDVAQDIAWDAYDEVDPRKRTALANKALRIYPYCADAYNVLSREIRTYGQVEKYAKMAVASFKKTHDKQFFDEDKSELYLELGGRLFMWGLYNIMDCNKGMELYERARDVAEEMLEWDNNDHLGVRYDLVHIYALTGDIQKAEKLMQRFHGGSALSAWGALLLSIACGDSDK